jgi:hypothetical protein
MQLSVIYSIDTPREISIAQFNPPPSQKRLWQLTENDSGYEYGYLEGRWAKGKHRKWCALLSRDQFQEFIDHTGLTGIPFTATSMAYSYFPSRAGRKESRVN